jgi:hypothetical protein
MSKAVVPHIDPDVIYRGVSWLRTLSITKLYKFADSGELCVLQAGNEPVSVLVPYDVFISMSKAIQKARR